MRDLPGYALVVAKDGPKLRPVTSDSKPKPEGCVRLMGNPIRPAAPCTDPPQGWSMLDLANFLTGQPALEGRHVFDQTGLQGIYEIDLNFAFLPNTQPPRPEIFDALQEQL